MGADPFVCALCGHTFSDSHDGMVYLEDPVSCKVCKWCVQTYPGDLAVDKDTGLGVLNPDGKLVQAMIKQFHLRRHRLDRDIELLHLYVTPMAFASSASSPPRKRPQADSDG